MGRPKKELKKIHRKKAKTAKKNVALYLQKDIPYEKLTQTARRFLEKRKRQESK